MITINSMNIMAPSWASKSFYPKICIPSLDINQRKPLILKHIENNIEFSDFFCLQETQLSTNKWLKEYFESYNYTYDYTYHDDNYWNLWKSSDTIFEKNGVSLAINMNNYIDIKYYDLNFGTGGHSCAAICTSKKDKKTIKIASVHLDSDNVHRRLIELENLKEWFKSESYHIGLIAGDFNTGYKEIKTTLSDFVDLIEDKPTYPYTFKNSVHHSIDHILYDQKRMSEENTIKIFGSDLWQLYPKRIGYNDYYANLRLKSNLEILGSDHFYLNGKIKI